MPLPSTVERDCLAGLGLLASTAIQFDPAFVTAGKVSHAHGFNVHCLVVDNIDGEVLALARNRIHADDNPLQHAEQIAVRAALNRLIVKRPRTVGVPVDKYYKSSLLMAPGLTDDDFFNRGCTLYNTFDPCGMCAVTLLVSYVKRISYIFEDEKFEAVYKYMKDGFFTGCDSVKEAVHLASVDMGGLVGKISALIRKLREKVHSLEHNPDPSKKVPLVLTLDHCYDDLCEAITFLIEADASQLTTTGEDLKKNSRTLLDLKRLCNIN